MKVQTLVVFLLFIFSVYESSSTAIDKPFHEIVNAWRKSDTIVTVYFQFYPASCSNHANLFKTSAKIDFSRSDEVSIGNSSSSSQIKVSCNNDNIKSAVCPQNSGCSSIGYDVCTSIQDIGSFTIKDVADIFSVSLEDLVSQLKQNGYQFADLLNAFDEDWETIAEKFDTTLNEMLNYYGVGIEDFVNITGAHLKQLLETFDMDFIEFVKEAGISLKQTLSIFGYDLRSLVSDVDVSIEDLEKAFGLTLPQIIQQVNLGITKFLNLFGISVKEFVQQTGATITDIKTWFDITYKEFIQETGAAITDIEKWFGITYKEFIQQTDADISDILKWFGISFTEFVQQTDATFENLLDWFNVGLDDALSFAGHVIEIIGIDGLKILCDLFGNSKYLKTLCGVRRMAVPIPPRVRRQSTGQRGNLYISTSSSSHGKCYHEDNSSPSSNSGGGSSVSCFPGSSTVYLDKFQSKPISELQVGETILDAHGKPTKVIGWLHKNENEEARYIQVKFTNMSSKLTISGDHLVFSTNGVIKSKQIVRGNKLLTRQEGFATVQSVKSLISKGVYAPLTESGTLLVDGISCSCYAYFSNHWVANLFIPIIWKLLKPLHHYEDVVSLAPVAIIKLAEFFK
ncbi:hypothetical protein GAYE_HTGSCF06PCTG21G0275 [Galdieria yellowstonensis]|uniref:Hint domain-containing protein n=1 Tax=Galdieria yellowstonensis TaxID=3028027 RepID=A0AAV9I6A8_9RHOD|nr:hypothetical protein GAYE_HTGSCF06PCTG21G0275 [Galdieria yellowstonensis]